MDAPKGMQVVGNVTAGSGVHLFVYTTKDGKVVLASESESHRTLHYFNPEQARDLAAILLRGADLIWDAGFGPEDHTRVAIELLRGGSRIARAALKQKGGSKCWNYWACTSPVRFSVTPRGNSVRNIVGYAWPRRWSLANLRAALEEMTG
ncbi:MAG: hypothetical protein A2Z21_09450 [Candidatus Fraserbacteria bacterium RBG_16_55_9]|uniref:Uncharacterized protein n=1 Tax=Fraserbacteria sp. (strain RBG_16_55_9) TaxID=1817864 RepID=A0A1F5UNS6_FRAXR|nr:MAG: hypothetical protein A2Z21_09450 [Candidatus Fraserbacteria bacterium RBG_16_55_9]